jgi:hypothetical protein
MESSLEDYYAILGVDQGASPEAIKLAYRRLARETHPDRNASSTEGEKSALSLQMATLNGAYAVLSDPVQRREYDKKQRIMDALAGSTASSRATGTMTATKSETSSMQAASRNHSGARVQTPPDVDLNLIRDLSNQIRSNLLGNPKGFAWKETVLEGFDWGLEYASWMTHYCIGGRGFGILDPAAARRFANHTEGVISRINRSVRGSQFLLILPFQHMSQWDSVSAELNRIFTLDDGKKRFESPVSIVLFDAHKGRKLRVGGELKDKRFEQVLHGLSPEVMNSQRSVSR